MIYNTPYFVIGIIVIVATLLIMFDMLVTSKFFRPLQRDEKIAAIIGGIFVIGIFGIVPILLSMSKPEEKEQ